MRDLYSLACRELSSTQRLRYVVNARTLEAFDHECIRVPTMELWRSLHLAVQRNLHWFNHQRPHHHAQRRRFQTADIRQRTIEKGTGETFLRAS